MWLIESWVILGHVFDLGVILGLVFDLVVWLDVV